MVVARWSLVNGQWSLVNDHWSLVILQTGKIWIYVMPPNEASQYCSVRENSRNRKARNRRDICLYRHATRYFVASPASIRVSTSSILHHQKSLTEQYCEASVMLRNEAS
jgi:hypothetical protein